MAIVALAAVVAVGGWLLWPKPSEESLIIELVAKAEHGVETKNAQEIVGCVARDYRDPSGLTHADIVRLAMQWQRTAEQTEVVIDEYRLEITPPTARGEFEVELSFSEGGRQGPPERMALTVEFEKQRTGLLRRSWLVKSVSGHGLERDVEGLM